jgi:1-acyl-sn-glycerol-3-phosphate acyltransferase
MGGDVVRFDRGPVASDSSEGQQRPGVGVRVFYWLMRYVFIGPWFRLFFRPWVEGLENIPKRGPIILCPNHLSFIDSFVIPLMVPKRRVVYLGKSDYFDKWYVKWFFEGAGVIPVRREGGNAGEASLIAGCEQLDKGMVVAVYPEGTRSPDGRLYKGKTGAARMALRAGVPVIPVAVFGTDEALPTGKYFPRRVRIGVRFGKPMDFTRYEGQGDDRFVLRSVTDEIMYELMMLSGREYVDDYASKFKGNIPKDSQESPPPARDADTIAS